MMKLCDRKSCCGCTACCSVCSRGAISMQPDTEGFLQPVVDSNKCIDCGLCVKVCPVLHKPAVERNTPKHLYAIHNKNEQIRRNSPSGGFFSLLAAYVVEKLGGYACGAVYAEDFTVKHFLTNSKGEIWRFSGSKYVQSDVKGIFPEVSKLLRDDQWVVFSGTPCQINGLLSYLRKPYEKLITVEVVCHGVPSPEYWKAYLDYQKGVYGSEVQSVNFRHKKYGFKSGSLMLQFRNGKQYFGSHDSDFMLRPFSQNNSLRWSCYECKFKGAERSADFTIYDGWHIGIWNKSMNDDKGTTLVYCHSNEAKSLFSYIAEQMKVQEIDAEDPWAIKDAVMMYNQPKVGTNREKIYVLLKNEGFGNMAKQIMPITAKLKIKILTKRAMGKLGLMSLLGKLKSLR